MKVLIAGLGSIGRRHLANLRALLPEADITVWRHAPNASGPGQVAGADRVVYEAQAALATGPEIALLASPAPFHIPAARMLAEQGVHLFIEKPLSHAADGVPELLAECERRQLVVMVGYNLRFDESLRAAHRAVTGGQIGKVICLRAEVGSYLPDWRPQSDYRQGVSARSDLGGGAVLELSHELDYVRWLGGEVAAVSAQLDRLGGLEIDVEDVAEITLRFGNGALAQVHLDLVQRAPTRTCRIVGTVGTLVWDGIASSVHCFTSETRTWSLIHKSSEAERNAMYVAELRHFLDCVRERRDPCVTAVDGWRTLEIALAAKRSHIEQRVVPL